jgi:uncharacterized protein (TIGR00369 family)
MLIWPPAVEIAGSLSYGRFMTRSSRPNTSEIKRLFETAPFIRHLGLQPAAVSPGRCETKLVLKRHHLQQDGVVHAGVLATVADHTAGAAGASLVGPDEYVLSVEFKINMLRAARGDCLYCFGTVLKPGRRLIVAEAEVFDGPREDQRLSAKATVTLAVMTKDSVEPAAAVEQHFIPKQTP